MVAESREKQEGQAAGGARGAAVADYPARAVIGAYIAHHRKTARESLIRLIRNPLASLMNWLVMGVALSLPLILLLLLTSVQSLGDGWTRSGRITVYLKQNLDQVAAMDLESRLRQRSDVGDVRLITRQQALAEFRESSGLGPALDYLQQNPLPNSLVITPARRDPEAVKNLGQAVAQLPGVDQVQVDLAWLKRLQAIARLVSHTVWALALLLGAAVLLVIGNTIRLAIESRRDEIVVAKLVGGTDGFVRRPFLYAGAWYGMGGSLMAILLVEIMYGWIAGPVATLAKLYGSNFQLQGAGIGYWMLVVLAGVLLGWGGAWIAVRRHLGAIEPR